VQYVGIERKSDTKKHVFLVTYIYITITSIKHMKRMISSVLFMESLVISSSLCRNIPSVKRGLPYVLKRITDQPDQISHGQYIQANNNDVNTHHRSSLPAKQRQPLKPVTTTIKQKHHIGSHRVSYTTSSMGQTTTSDELAIKKFPVETLGEGRKVPAGLVGGGWGLEWCSLVEIVAAAYFENGLDCSENSYRDKIFYNLYNLGIPAIRERTIYSTIDGVSICRGRVDLEIGSSFILELKIIEPSPNNIQQDSKQLMRYLRTYRDMQKTEIQKAALVYLFGGEVRFIEVSLETEKKVRFEPYGRK